MRTTSTDWGFLYGEDDVGFWYCVDDVDKSGFGTVTNRGVWYGADDVDQSGTATTPSSFGTVTTTSTNRVR